MVRVIPTNTALEAIPFNRACTVGNETRYIAYALERGRICGDGWFTARCHEWLEEHVGVHRALLTTSCTHALELAALLLDIQPGDEIIIPSFTFVSSVNAFVLRGARPIFADIRPDTLNLDESKLEGLITPRTRAIVVVHYAGVACEMDDILRIASRHGVSVVEDNAHGLFGRYKGRNLGTFGSLATQSFHETKNITCGEGGALLINEEQYSERAEILREKGTNRSQFFRGQVDKYSWVDIGSSYLPSDMLAAFLYAQFEAANDIQAKRREVWQRYDQCFRGWIGTFGVDLPHVPEHCEQSYHMYYLILPSLQDRQDLIQHLRERNILSVFHYVPLHLSAMGQLLGGQEADCAVTESVSDRLVRLPFYNDLTPEDQDRVIDGVRTFLERRYG